MQYQSTAEIAAKLGRSPATVKRWRRLRKGPPYLVIEGRPVYDLAEVQSYLEQHRPAHAKPKSGSPEINSLLRRSQGSSK